MWANSKEKLLKVTEPLNNMTNYGLFFSRLSNYFLISQDLQKCSNSFERSINYSFIRYKRL